LKRIAFLGRGVHTLPTYRALLNRLSQDYLIIVYSEVSLQPSWLTLDHQYEFRSSKLMNLPRRIRELLFPIWLIKEYLKKPFDVVHAHSTFPTGLAAVILQLLFQVPAIVSLDGGEGSSLPDLQFGDAHHRIRKAINKWVINQAHIVSSLTYFQRDEIYKNLAVKREIRVIPRGVDNRKFHYSQSKIKSSVRFLSVGYLSPIKDPETLLKTFSIIQQQIDCQLIHIGKDYMNGWIQQRANDMGISHKVRFVEPIDYDNISEYYKNADILLHTARFESQGMVIVEAMSSGTLVCGTHVGLMSDLSGECCITVPPKEPEALAAAVLDLLDSAEKMERLRMNAYNWSKNHSLDHSVKAFCCMYAELTK